MLTTAKSIQLLDASGLNISPITDITSLYYETTVDNMVVRKYVYTGFPVAVNINQKTAQIVDVSQDLDSSITLNYNQKLVNSSGGDILVSNISTSILPGTTYRLLDITNYNLSLALFNYAPKTWVNDTFNNTISNVNSSILDISNNLLQKINIINSSITIINSSITNLTQANQTLNSKIETINSSISRIDQRLIYINSSLNDIYGDINTVNLSYFYDTTNRVFIKRNPNTFYWINYNVIEDSSTESCVFFTFDCSLFKDAGSSSYGNVKILTKTNKEGYLDNTIYKMKNTVTTDCDLSDKNLVGTYRIHISSENGIIKPHILILYLKDIYNNVGYYDFITPAYKYLNDPKILQFIDIDAYNNGNFTNNTLFKPIRFPMVTSDANKISIKNNYINGNLYFPVYYKYYNSGNLKLLTKRYREFNFNNNHMYDSDIVFTDSVRIFDREVTIETDERRNIMNIENNFISNSSIFFNTSNYIPCGSTAYDVSFNNNVISNSHFEFKTYQGDDTSVRNKYIIGNNIIEDISQCITIGTNVQDTINITVGFKNCIFRNSTKNINDVLPHHPRAGAPTTNILENIILENFNDDVSGVSDVAFFKNTGSGYASNNDNGWFCGTNLYANSFSTMS